MSELRAMFNAAELWLKVQRGDLHECIVTDGHPSPPLSDDPICTRSQIVAYKADDGREIARVHQYKRPDGALGGTSRRPDPQEMLGPDGRLYFGGLYPDAEA